MAQVAPFFVACVFLAFSTFHLFSVLLLVFRLLAFGFCSCLCPTLLDHVCCPESLSRVPLFAIPWTVAHQAPLSMEVLQTRVLEWVDMPSFRGSSQPRDQTRVSLIAGRFFTVWATSKAQEYWSGQPVPSPGDLPDPGVELGSPARQVDSWPSELPGKPVRLNNGP